MFISTQISNANVTPSCNILFLIKFIFCDYFVVKNTDIKDSRTIATLLYQITIYRKKELWNKNKLVGQKLALKLQQIWAIRIRFELVGNFAIVARVFDTKMLSKSDTVIGKLDK